MFKKPQTWVVILSGMCVVAGAVGVFVFGDGAGAGLMAASAVALLLGISAFVILVVWRLATEGVNPVTQKQVETAGIAGEAIGHILGTAVVWGFAAAGLAALIGKRGGTVFWIVTASAVIIGAFLGAWRARRFRP
jgi:hypothetical protein